ncbi:DEAD/DEAH box helicase [Thiomicrolovo sp. ZZH C-3]
MSTVTLDILADEGIYELKGAIDCISSNRRARSNFKSIGTVFGKDSLRIPFELDVKESKEKKFNEIVKLLKKFDFNYGQSASVESELYDMQSEHEKFDVFSIKAYEIRNNICDSADFSFFTNTLEMNMVRTLYPIQLLSAYHLAFSQNACNFSVPGAGKTSIVYGAYCFLKSMLHDNPKSVNKILIVGPLAAFAPWEDEFVACFGQAATSKRISGELSKTERQNYFYSQHTSEITLISYQSLASSKEDINHFLKKNRVMVVLDEAHKIKNTENGIWASSALEISKYAKSRVVLTGTPVPNGYKDIYNLYKFIWPYKNVLGFSLHHLDDMTKNYAMPRTRKMIDQLIQNIAPFFIRIRKSDLGLPLPIENPPIYVDMGSEQRSIYDFIEKKYIESLQTQSQGLSVGSELNKAKLIRMMQCSTNPALLSKAIMNISTEENYLDVDDSEIMRQILDYKNQEVPPKFLKTIELIKRIIAEDGPKGKVIVWTIFIDNMDYLQELLQAEGIDSRLLRGDVPSENENIDEDELTREKIIRGFHKEDSPYKVIIANPFAVGESISLHKACHNAIYLERDFNASRYLQSKDRIHRYGLKDEDVINYYYVLSKEAIDETIHRRLIDKERRMMEIIENEEIPLINMNMDYEEDMTDDIKALIRDYVARTSSKA